MLYLSSLTTHQFLNYYFFPYCRQCELYTCNKLNYIFINKLLPNRLLERRSSKKTNNFKVIQFNYILWIISGVKNMLLQKYIIIINATRQSQKEKMEMYYFDVVYLLCWNRTCVLVHNDEIMNFENWSKNNVV